MRQESAVEDLHLLTSQPPKWKYTLGVVSLILVVIGWVGTNFLIGVFCSRIEMCSNGYLVYFRGIQQALLCRLP
jgi:hypothetical protein